MTMDELPVVIVSGLPRSGTSMMMQMLEAGGLEPLTDGIRKANEHNPRGYYEFEPVKKTAQDPSWVKMACGKAVNMVYTLLYDLPPGSKYLVISMRRDLREVVASQNAMLDSAGENGKLGDERIAGLFSSELRKFDEWLSRQRRFSVLCVDYKDVIQDPLSQSKRVNAFLGGYLNTAAMAAAVKLSLYRNRK